MTRTMLALAAAGCMLVLPQASSAAPTSGTKLGLSAPAATDVAWRHHSRHHGYWYGRGYYPTAHSFRRQGRCVEDLGYGRVEVCD
jgi:hypothetical protein